MCISSLYTDVTRGQQLMKKGLFIFLISISVLLALAGDNPVKADELVPGEIITVTPALTPTELKEKVTTSFLLEYLRQGGSIDLTNKDPNYGVDDFINNFADLIEELVQPVDEFNVLYNPFDTGTRVNPTAMCYTGVKIFTDMLPSIQEPVTPITPSPNPDYNLYLNTINGHNNAEFFWYYMQGSLSNGLNRPNEYDNIGFFGLQPIYYSWCYIFGDVGYRDNIIGDWQVGDNTGAYVYPMPITDVNIYNNGVNYSFTINQTITPNLFKSASYGDVGNLRNGGRFEKRDNDTYWLGGYVNANQSTFQLTYTGTLSQCFDVLCQYVRNVNIYVDGVPWSIIGDTSNYYVGLGSGTFVEGTNTPVEWKYDEDIYIDIQNILDRLETLIENQNKITFPDFSDLIVNANGQPAVAIVDVTPQDNIDDWYVKNYGTLIPLFPVFVTYPVSVNDIANVATIGIVDVIPDDLIEIFGIALIGMLFVTFIHRLLE